MSGKKSKIQIFLENKYVVGVKFVLCGAGAIIIAALAISALMTTTDLGEGIITIFGILALSAGGFTTGYISGKKKRKNGLINGLFYGVLLFLLLFFLGFPIAENGISGLLFVKLTVILLFSTIGGIKGVNTRLRITKKC